jgi:hypothetical protein
MALNDLTTTSGGSPQRWVPPGEKKLKNWLMIGTVGVVGGGVFLFFGNQVVPLFTKAVVNITDLLNTGMGMVWVAAGLLASVIAFKEIFLPGGKINGLIQQFYSSLAYRARMELLVEDPISPLKDNRERVAREKEIYSNEFAKFDGQVSAFKQSQQEFLLKAKEAGKRAKAAHDALGSLGQDGDPDVVGRYQKAFRDESYRSQEAKKTADNFAEGIETLSRIRKIILRLDEAADEIIRRLDIDIENLTARWNMSKTMRSMRDAANKIIKSDSKTSLAKEAEAMINQNYAQSIGMLENMRDQAMPMLQSMDLDQLAAANDMLDQWEQELVALPSSGDSSGVRVGAVLPNAHQQGAVAPGKFTSLL